MTKIFIKNLPMLIAGVVLGVSTSMFISLGYAEVSTIDHITITIEYRE